MRDTVLALLQGLTAQIGTASEAADQADERLVKLRHSLRQLSRELRTLRWLLPVLMGTAAQPPEPIRSVSIARAIEAVPRPQPLIDIALSVPAWLEVRAAPGALETVLRHLIANIGQHAPDVPARITARLCRVDEHPRPDALQCAPSVESFVLLTVADQGPGIHPSVRPALFQAPHGLWLCQKIVRAHGGDLWVDETQAGASLSSSWPCLYTPTRRGPLHADLWPAMARDFARAARRGREGLKLTRADLSIKTGLAESTIRNVETGRHAPTRKVRERLVSALETAAQRIGPPPGWDKPEPPRPPKRPKSS